MTVNTFDKNGIKFTEVINDNGFKVILSNLGASIYLVRYDKYVFNRNVRNIEDFKITNQYYGKTIGRTSNRLKGHKFRIGEKIFDVEPNEGNNILHGGKYGLSCSYFTVHTTSLLDKTIVSYETTLSNDGYMKSIDELTNDNCSGVVYVMNNGGQYNYLPSLNCSNYSTDNIKNRVIYSNSSFELFSRRFYFRNGRF